MIYYRDTDRKRFRRLGRHEVIKRGDLQAYDGYIPLPVTDPNIIGKRVAMCDDGKKFYSPITRY